MLRKRQPARKKHLSQTSNEYLKHTKEVVYGPQFINEDTVSYNLDPKSALPIDNVGFAIISHMSENSCKIVTEGDIATFRNKLSELNMHEELGDIVCVNIIIKECFKDTIKPSLRGKPFVLYNTMFENDRFYEMISNGLKVLTDMLPIERTPKDVLKMSISKSFISTVRNTFINISGEFNK